MKWVNNKHGGGGVSSYLVEPDKSRQMLRTGSLDCTMTWVIKMAAFIEEI